MKFLCLAYGDEAGWKSLTDDERFEVLAQDAAIRERGNLMSAVKISTTSVTNWDKHLEVVRHPYSQHELPLAGFSVIEAKDADEVVKLVSNTPCARAKGVIEIRPLWEFEEGARI